MRTRPLLALLLALPGCGGKVVFDPLAEGAGGASAATTASSSSGGGEADPCDTGCGALAAHDCVGGDVSICTSLCAATRTQHPACEVELNAVAACNAKHAGEAVACYFEPCIEAMGALQTCLAGPACSIAYVMIDASDCDAQATCGQDSVYVNCLPGAPNPMAWCQCSLNGNIVGECYESGPFVCDFVGGCCAEFL